MPRGRKLGYKCSDETKKKMSEAIKAAWARRKAKAVSLAVEEPTEEEEDVYYFNEDQET